MACKPLIALRLCAVFPVLWMSACSEMPQFSDTNAQLDPTSEYPQLIDVTPLFAEVPAPRTSSVIQPRIDGLQARAQALRDRSVVDPATQGRLSAGIDTGALR